MEKNSARRKVLFLTIGAILFVLIVNISLGLYLQNKNSGTISTTPAPKQIAQEKNETFSYKGEDGKDALTLLKAKVDVELDQVGMVVSINNRKAENAKKEFWAFYVNGKMADVGSAEYQTKNEDMIEWKIEKY